ncbi:MAG: HAD-IIIA family hydrolase [Nitrospirae bacterium]|nr:MAG: HAD-IIIA family hydrolase [Nitrospirota bacterium]
MNLNELEQAASKIKLLILDVDGVLTDGGIILDNEGNEFKRFDVRDGHGIKLLIRHGVEVAIITGRFSRVVQRRAHELGIKEVYQKCYDKIKAYERIKENLSVVDREIAYMGDDIVDIPVMIRVGLPVAVADAHEEAKRYARYITASRGGRGAVREVAEMILKAKGLWEEIIGGYTRA